MKILHIIGQMATGGAEKAAVIIANGLANGGIETQLAVMRKSQDSLAYLVDNKVRVKLFNRRSRYDLKVFSELRKFIKSGGFDIIHVHNTPIYFVSIATIGLAAKLVWHDNFGGTDTKLVYRSKGVHKMLFKKLSAYVAVNRPLAEWAERFFPRQKIYYIPNTSENTSIDDRTEQLQLPGSTSKRILQLANFKPQKDHANAVKAFAEVHKEVPEAYLICVGKIIDHEYFEEIRQLVSLSGLDSNVIFFTDISNPFQIINSCSVGLLSSVSEGLPLALLEYGLGGLIPVATNVGQCKEVVSSPEVGFLVSPNNYKELAVSLKQALKNVSSGSLMANNFRDYILKNYSKEQVVKTVIAMYNELR